MKIAKLEISKSKREEINKMLELNEAVGGKELNGVIIESFTAKVEDTSLEVDIKLVDTEDGPYLDIILFEDGYEMYCLEPQYELNEEYEFEYEGEPLKVLISFT